MLLQPLIENSIKHGLEPRIEGGTVTLRSRLMDDGRLLVEVEDDGVGMAPGRSSPGTFARPGTGIGMKNVRERMQVLYGEGAEVTMESRPGRGTKVSLLMPVLDSSTPNWGKDAGGPLKAPSKAPFTGSSKACADKRRFPPAAPSRTLEQVQIEQNISLAPFTTLGIGGPARFFARVHSEFELLEAVQFARAEGLPLFPLGGGSNLPRLGSRVFPDSS